ncbi:hypothetical protein ACU4GR_10745 (plasmid) [Methylobacterium oryzae CBMB20]
MGSCARNAGDDSALVRAALRSRSGAVEAWAKTDASRSVSPALGPAGRYRRKPPRAGDYPGVREVRYEQLDVGRAPSMSRGPNTNPVVFALLTEAVRAEEIPFQVSVFPSATPTDANAMQINRGRMAVGLLGVAARYMHTPCELSDLTDLHNCVRLMVAYCRRITRRRISRRRRFGLVLSSGRARCLPGTGACSARTVLHTRRVP